MRNWYTGETRSPLRDGVEIELKGQKFIVAPFRLKQSLAVARARDAMGDAKPGSPAGITFLVATATIALSQNYPSMTTEMLDEELNTNDVVRILQAHQRAEENGKA